MNTVVATYNTIASQFSKTRNRNWADFELFKKCVQCRVSVLDVGCGNGRLVKWIGDNTHFTNFKREIKPSITEKGYGETAGERGFEYVGIDASDGMIREAKFNYPDHQFQVADMRALPFVDNSFDVIFAVASFHHMLTRGDQHKALAEMYRVLKQGGVLCMTNWNLWRLTFREKSWWRYNFPSLPRMRRIVTTIWQGHPLPYYSFTVRELRALVKNMGYNIEILFYSTNGKKAHWWNGKNIVLRARK